MKKLIYLITIIVMTNTTQATNYGSANKVCTINGDNMVIELQGSVLRYIIDDYAYHTPPNDRNYSKGDLYVSNLNSMNVVKIWHFPENTGNFGARINSPLKFDLTGRYGTYGPFNVYSLKLVVV
jgi:hypothetical protein